MILAIPVEEQSVTVEVCPSFGRAPYYMIYNSSDESVRFMVNDAAKASGGAGIKAAQGLVDEKVDAVATPRCGTNSAEVLEGASIKIYKSVYGSVQVNIDSFVKGTLPILGDFHAGFHGHGGQ